MLGKCKQHILFIGHEGSLSGAPVLLLNLLLLLKEQQNIRFTVVLGRGGPIAEKCREHFKVLILKPDGYAHEGSLFGRGMGILKNRLKLVRTATMALSADLIFSNTIANGELLKILSFLKKPVVTYVHELEKVLQKFVSSGIAGDTIKHSSSFAYPSLRVKEVLQQEFNIPETKLHRLSYYFPVNKSLVNDVGAKDSFVQHFREKYALKGMIVGGMGLGSDRKGTDIFIRVCEKVISRNDQITFCWIGGFENDEVEQKLRALNNAVIFTGPLPHNYYNPAVFDLLFLSSREDPYPLVVLEAGFMGVPSICFKESGGIPEFVGEDAGWTIPGFDEDKAAETILSLYDRRQQIKEKGEHAFDKSMSMHADGTVIMNQLSEIIRTISSS
jgi:glycosyltransferase involved in cell wall biosynthesis